jgi:hypothetical protein
MDRFGVVKKLTILISATFSRGSQDRKWEGKKKCDQKKKIDFSEKLADIVFL